MRNSPAMRVLILTHGSRGDVQPFAALAKALVEAGHEAMVGAPASSAYLVEPYGACLIPFDDTVSKLLAGQEVREAIETDYHGMRGKKGQIQILFRFRRLMAKMLDDIALAAECGADIVVHHVGLPGHEVAERLGVPAVPVCLHPSYVPTRSFPNPRFPFWVPRALNRASYLSTKLLMWTISGNTGRWRKDRLGLPYRYGHRNVLRRPDRTPATILQAFSKYILPPEPSYPGWVHTTGYWTLPASADWVPPGELSDFLTAGAPPIYVGFGSMAGADPRRTGRLVVEAIRRAKARAVIASGWGGIQSDNAEWGDVLYINEAPHGWLLPRMAAVVHHGGSGTTGAALAAGRPQVVCPFVADQPFHARRMHEMGVASTPQPQRSLNPDDLARAIVRATTDGALATRARELRDQVRAEGGVNAAIKLLESLV